MGGIVLTAEIKGLRNSDRMRSALKQMKKKWRVYVFLLLPVAYIVIFSYVPMYGIQIAFRHYTTRGGFTGSEWVGMENIMRYFKSYYFWRTIRNTLFTSVYWTVVMYPLSILMALMINASPFPRFRSAVQNITYMPNFISVVVMAGMILQFLNVGTGPYGIAYRFLLNGAEPPNLLAMPQAFRHIYVWSSAWQGLGWSTIIYIAALAAVDPSLHEAAIVDGASRWQRILHVDIPGIMPTMIIKLILTMGGILSIGFDKAYLLQNDMNISASEMISTYTYKAAFESAQADYSYSTAIGLFNSVVNGIVLIIVNTTANKLSGSSLW